MEIKQRAIHFCKELLHCYLEKRDFQSVKRMLAGQSSWIGTGENEISNNYAQIGRRLDEAQEKWQGRFSVINDWYQCVPISAESFAVYGELDLREVAEYPILIQMHLRFSLICRLEGELFQLVHAHFSTPNAEQEPGEFVPQRMVQSYNRQLEQKLAERSEELRQKNLALSTLSENIPSGIFYIQTGQPDRVTYCNRGFLELTGIASRKFVEKNVQNMEKFFHPADRKRVYDSIRRQLACDIEFREECRILRSDQEVRWVVFRGKRIADEKGRQVLCCVLIDQTDARRAQEEARKKENDFRMLVENIPGGVKDCLNDECFTICYVSDGFLSLFGYTREEVYTLFQNQYLNMIHPKDRQKVIERLKQQLSAGNTIELVYRGVCKSGEDMWILNKGRLVSEDGEEHLHCVLVDITEFRKAQEALNISEERYRIICEQSNDIIFEYNILEHTAFHSANFQKIFGYPAIEGNYPFDAVENGAIHPEDANRFLDLFDQVRSGVPYAEEEVRIRRKDNTYLWCRIQVSTILDHHGNPVKAIGKYVDIDQQRREWANLTARAERDSLTGLYNKETTRILIERSLERSKEDQHHALFIVDIDNFKGINDHLGHLFGDVVLSETAQEIQSIFRSSDIIGRIGGDEFLVFLQDIGDERMVKQKAQVLESVFHSTYSGTSREYRISGSVGIAQYPKDGSHYTELFQKADQALYYAKSHGKDNFAVYDEQIGQNCLLSWEGHSALSDPAPSEGEQKPFGEHVIEYIFKIFYENNDLDAAINLVLGLVGQCFGADRAYVFEISEDGQRVCNTFEWCSQQVDPRKERFQDIPIQLFPICQRNFDENGVFYCQDIRQLTDGFCKKIYAEDVTSFLQVAIVDQGRFTGCVGVDGCGKKLYPTQKAVESLKIIAQVISTFLLKKNTREKLDQAYQMTQTVLDQIDLWAYVIDPDTYELLYINQKTEQLVPDAKLGEFCYDVFQRRETPCPGCPLLELSAGQLQIVRRVHNDFLNLWLKVTASRMDWVNGKTVFLMSCSDLTSVETNEEEPDCPDED